MKFDLIKALREVDDYVVTRHGDYEALLNEFNKYRGMVVDDSNMDHINNVIMDMQKVYADLHPYFHYVCGRADTCQKKVKEYNEWVKSMEAAGAHKVDSTTGTPIEEPKEDSSILLG